MYKPNLGKSVEDATNWGSVKEADRSQTQGGHGGMVNASAGLPPSQQVDDGPDGDQYHIAKAKANVASKVLASGITHAQACSCRDCCDQQPAALYVDRTTGGLHTKHISCLHNNSCTCLYYLKQAPKRTSDWNTVTRMATQSAHCSELLHC